MHSIYKFRISLINFSSSGVACCIQGRVLVGVRVLIKEIRYSYCIVVL